MEAANKEGLWVDPLLTRPKHVAVVALGPSCKAVIAESMSTPGMKNPFDEVWTLNRGLRGFMHDKLFLMDDLRWLEKHDKTYARWVRKHNKPTMVSTVYHDYPNAVAYPLHEVMEYIKDDIFTQNTVSYMIAYAMYIEVERLSVYGADFVYPNGNFAEKGGMAVAYLLGMCQEKGIKFRLPAETTMLYANTVKMAGSELTRVHYGYHRKDQMRKEKQRGIKSRKGA